MEKKVWRFSGNFTLFYTLYVVCLTFMTSLLRFLMVLKIIYYFATEKFNRVNYKGDWADGENGTTSFKDGAVYQGVYKKVCGQIVIVWVADFLLLWRGQLTISLK